MSQVTKRALEASLKSLLLQKPLLMHPLPLRLYAVIAIILLRQQPFLQRICSIISAFPKSLILRVSAVLNCT